MPKRIQMPGFIKPQLATLRSKAPKGDQWLHEIKYDGYRVQVHLTAAGRRSTPATGWTGRNASPRLPGRWLSQAKPSSTEKWWSFMKGVLTFPNCRQS
jgi:hypothetical protein